MSIESICKTSLTTASKTSRLGDISELMKKNNEGCVVIIETDRGKSIPVGIITDRDLAMTIGTTPKPQKLDVRSIMTSPVICIGKDEGISESIVKMNDHGIRRMPVVNKDGSLVGIVSSEDLTLLLSEELAQISQIKERRVKNHERLQMPVVSHLQF